MGEKLAFDIWGKGVVVSCIFKRYAPSSFEDGAPEGFFLLL